jgi:hypothetical protein
LQVEVELFVELAILTAAEDQRAQPFAEF